MRTQSRQSGFRHRRLPEGPHLRCQRSLRPLHARPRLHDQSHPVRERRRARPRRSTLPADARHQPRYGRSRHGQKEHRQHPAIPQAVKVGQASRPVAFFRRPPSPPPLPAIIFLMRKVTLPILILLFVLQARPANNFALTIDNIMRGPALYGYEPTAVRWTWDGARLIFQWKQNTEKEIAPMDTYTVNRDGSGLRKLTDEEIKQLPPAQGDTTKDKRLMAYSSAGDLYTLDNTTGKVTQLTKTTDTETNPRFTQDGKRISFTRNGNLYMMSLDSGLLVQLTDIRAANAPATSAAPAAGGGGGGRGQIGKAPWRERA